MRTYTCLTTGDRYSVASLSFQSAPDEAAARASALHDQVTNPHHLAIEVREGERLLFVERRKSAS